MTTHFTYLARRAAEDGIVSSDEVLALRRQGWGDGIIARDEAEALFALNDALDERSDEWCDFFVEAIGEFVLNGRPPRRQCDETEARWLIDRVDHDGALESVVELETLVRILERAENTPDILKRYVLEQIEREVLTGIGPTRCGGELSATHISTAECKILRRVIFASGGHGTAAVSRFDAEMLFRLKDETLADENAPEWDQLFLDGVSNFIRGFVMAHAQLGHSQRLGMERRLESHDRTVKGFMRGMVSQKPDARTGVNAMLGVMFGRRTNGGEVSEYAGAKINAAAEAGAQFTDFEREWLEKMVQADGKLDDLEKRLIKRLEAEG